MGSRTKRLEVGGRRFVTLRLSTLDFSTRIRRNKARMLLKTKETGNSCGAATESSPRRKPWVLRSSHFAPALKGRQISKPSFLDSLCRPYRASEVTPISRGPTADAVGYLLSALWASEQNRGNKARMSLKTKSRAVEKSRSQGFGRAKQEIGGRMPAACDSSTLNSRLPDLNSPEQSENVVENKESRSSEVKELRE